VSGDRFSLCRALFQCPRCKGVPQVMNARRPCTIGSNTGKLANPMETVFYRARRNPQVAGRQEQVVIRRCQSASLFDVALERFCRRRMEWNKTALAELGFTDLQHATGKDVLKSEVERLRNTEPCCRKARATFRKLAAEVGTSGEAASLHR